MNKSYVINSEMYWKVHAWMIQDLNLKGLSLNVFAILYNSTEKRKCFEKSFLSKMTGASTEGIRKTLKKLQAQGLIKINNIFGAYGERIEIVMLYSRTQALDEARKAQYYQTLKEELAKENLDTHEEPKNNVENSENQHQQNGYPLPTLLVPPTNFVGTQLNINNNINNNTYNGSSQPNVENSSDDALVLLQMKEMAINKNHLSRADQPYKALLQEGFKSKEILNAWQEHQRLMNLDGREARYYTALWKWLSQDKTNKDSARRQLIEQRNLALRKQQQRMREQLLVQRENQIEQERRILNSNAEYVSLKQKMLEYYRKALFSLEARQTFDLLNKQLIELKDSILGAVRTELSAV